MQDGGCDFWTWHDDATTPFLKQLLLDLRDKIWALTNENAKLRGALSEGRAKFEQQRAQIEPMRVQRAEKDIHVAALGERVKKLEKERVALLLALLACACVCVSMLIR
jgi:predicted nuclease with TOPRIM domain